MKKLSRRSILLGVVILIVLALGDNLDPEPVTTVEGFFLLVAGCSLIVGIGSAYIEMGQAGN
jgi:hypothetical protein